MMDAIERLWRRVQLLVGRGRIGAVDDSSSVQVLQVRLGADETKDDLPRIAEYGLTSNPPLGTDALVIFLGGERTNGVVVGTNNQAARLTGLAPGEVALYDNLGRFVLLKADGIHVQGNASPVTVVTTSDITATAGGNVTLTAQTKITLSAPTVEIDATTTSVSGLTQLTNVAVSGTITNAGHDIGHGHEHLPGSFKANTTNVTGVSGAVTP